MDNTDFKKFYFTYVPFEHSDICVSPNKHMCHMKINIILIKGMCQSLQHSGRVMNSNADARRFEYPQRQPS